MPGFDAKTHDKYENPLCARYASAEMARIFSADNKFSTWRRLWIALAEAERELGLDISEEQIAEMRAHVFDIDYEAAAAREKIVRHDVMAHIYAFGECCPSAKPIIHLGATSCYVGDNTDIIVMKDALALIRSRLVSLMGVLAGFAERHKNQPTLAYTHFQAAQPTTVGKRACLWLQDLSFDLERLDFTIERLRLLGCRGATGTSASFLELFDGDKEKVSLLERKICAKMGFASVYGVSGQTYPRKVDDSVMSALSGLAQSAYKFSNDFRLLSHLKEFDEPFEDGQVGSSAMAYKRNPMRSERIASLSRYVLADSQNTALTASSQWLERTLDDSANKRIAIPEAFLAVDAILGLYRNIIAGCSVYPKIIERHLNEELPFMATENILMFCVKKGGDRQSLHEAIREHSVAAGAAIKREGAQNDLISRILADGRFAVTTEEMAEILAPEKFVGLAREQTEAFVAEIREALSSYQGDDTGVEIRV